MSKEKKIALLYSGGLDSVLTTILHKDTPNVTLVHISNLKTETNIREDTYLPAHFRLPAFYPFLSGKEFQEIRVYELDGLERPGGFVPLRNLLFSVMAVMHDYDEVWLCAVKGEGSKDKSHTFFREASNLCSFLLDKPIIIRSPVAGYTKTELVKHVFVDRNIDKSILRYIPSCYYPSATVTGRCGKCQACLRRWVATTLNNIYEPHDESPFYYAEKLLQNKKEGLNELRRQPLSRWPGLILNNQELLYAYTKELHRRRSI